MKWADGTWQLVLRIFQPKKKNGFGFIWLCQGAGFEAHFIAKFKDWLISCCTQNWHLEIESDGKYKWFYLFKCTFEPEKYLLLMTNKWLRDTLAKFRLGVCGLKNHKQWFTTREEGNLTCHPMCGQSFEDEVHFLFQC